MFYCFAASSSSSSLSFPKPDNWFANVNSQLNGDQREDGGQPASLWPCRDGKVGHLNDKESAGWKDIACLIELVLMLMGGVNFAKGNRVFLSHPSRGCEQIHELRPQALSFCPPFIKWERKNGPDIPAEQSLLHRKAVWLSVWPNEQGRSVFTVDSEQSLQSFRTGRKTPQSPKEHF